MKIQDVRFYLVELERAGRLRSSFQESALIETERLLRNSAVCVSNDRHVVALAIVSGARTIATNDLALTKDVKNKRILDGPRGRVYSDPTEHEHLLRHTSSCGIAT